MKIGAAFHTRNDDWILPHKLRVLSALADHIVVIADRSPASMEIVRRFPKAVGIEWKPSPDLIDRDEHGSVTCDEGAMRQMAWDALGAAGCGWMLLGDTDEIPTPSVASVIASPPTKAHGYHVDLVNLWRGVDRYIGGDCIYSPTHPGRNRRPAICRYVPGTFDTAARKHVQLHPKGYQTIPCESVKQIHYKFAHWPRWTASPQSKSDKYTGYLSSVAPQAMPQNWLWMWDADAWAASLPQPVAVVGNGTGVNAGREIDSHAYVIRLNNWRTEGFEDRVGWRTDCWATSGYDNIIRRAWTRDLVCPFGRREYHDEGCNLGTWLGEYPHTHWPARSWADDARKLIRRPSTGLTLLCGLARAGVTVNCYGFDGMTTGHYWQTDHQHGHESEADALRKLPPTIRFR